MKKLYSLIFCFFLSSPLFAIQKESRAGVLPYAVDPQGKVNFLLGVEARRATGTRKYVWGELSGSQNSDEIDYPRMTAARIFNEATRCYFGLPAQKALLENPKKPSVSICKEGLNYILPRLDAQKLISLNQGHHVYLVQIDWVDQQSINNAPTIYEDGKLLPGANKKAFIWVPVTEVQEQLKKAPSKMQFKLPDSFRTKWGISLSPTLYDLLSNEAVKKFMDTLIAQESSLNTKK